MANQKFDPLSSLAIAKQQWRLHLKKIRQELPANRRIIASAQACQRLNKMCQKARFVLSFASFGSEINLWPLNHQLAAEGRLVLPLLGAKNQLELFQVSNINQLEPHRYGMLEPKRSECSSIELSKIEISLIPGLGFDLQTNYRLGYGLGSYDRLLASMSGVQAWGIGFLEQSVKQLPHSKEDVPLNQIYLF